MTLRRQLLRQVRINMGLARALAALTAIAVITSCSSPERRDLNHGLSLAKQKDFKEAIIQFRHVIQRSPESPESLIAAREGAKVAFFDLKDFKSAAEFSHHTILAASDLEEREAAQKQLATIYFEHLTDYPAAVREINKALTMKLPEKERIYFRLKLAKAYYFQNNFTQAESEANDFLKTELQDDDAIFQMMVLKGNVYLAKKDIAKATETLRAILKKYPERAVKENVAMTLAVAFEEQKNYKEAVAVLEQMRPYHSTPEYIDLRIKKLKEDQKNQPGVRGPHK